MQYEKCKKELKKFMIEGSVGHITFEVKPNGDLMICKQETELLKK